MGLRLLMGREKRDEKYKINKDEYISEFFKIFKISSKIMTNLTLILYNPVGSEPKVVQLLKKTSGKLFIDVGANIGYYSVLLSSRYRKIVAIEPEPHNMEKLKRNIQGLSNILLLNYAISDKNGYTKLFLGDTWEDSLSLSGRHSISPNHNLTYPYTNERSILVPTRTLESLFSNMNRIDLIKVDVEGAEFQVFSGSEKIMQNIKAWIIELHDLKQKPLFEKLLCSNGYDYLWIDSNHLYAIQKKESALK